MRGRYAPSPTGPLHLGNLRTALAAWLFARAAGSQFLIRIEDLDPDRSREQWITAQLADLSALGLDWDGEPIRQSERAGDYALVLARLEDQGLTYECFCTRAEIRAAASAPHAEDLPEGAYPGTCRELSGAERAKRADGRAPAIRVRADGARIEVEDRIAEHIEGVVDDFVVRRNDGVHAYNLGVVVDDAEQGIEEVVRGADLLDSTPRQLWLAERLGVEPPRSYAHVPLVLGSEGNRLAKRDCAVTLADRIGLGEDPIAVRSRLAASIGLCEPGERPTLGELLDRFDPDAHTWPASAALAGSSSAA